MMRCLHSTLLLASVSAFGISTSFAQIEGPAPTQATVSIESKQPVELDTSKLRVQVNGKDTALTSLVAVKPQRLEIAILIDDGLRSSFGIQLQDMKDFLVALPPGAQVLVGYMENGRVVSDSGFTADHAAAAQSVRLPESVPGASASPYFCLSDFVKRWPSSAQATRVVLMLTNGVDPYNGRPSIMNQDSPYVEAAVEDSQRAGVAVYSIPYHEAGLPGGYGSLSGQSYLEQVADGTGGRVLYIGSLNPVSLRPFLNDLLADLRESYTATFDVNVTHAKEKTLDRLKITSSQPGVKVHAPDAVHPGGDSAHE